MDDERVGGLRIGDPTQHVPRDVVGFAGFSLWRHEFRESRWLELRVRPDWLWIRTGAGGLVVAADFPNAPTGPED